MSSQVGRLLHSLQIDPRALPGAPDQAAWDAAFKSASDPRLRHPSAAADVAAGSQLGARAGAPNGCAIQPALRGFQTQGWLAVVFYGQLRRSR